MTLTPNTQITQENVGLLKAGDWLMPMDDRIGTVFEKGVPVSFVKADVEGSQVRVKGPRCGPHNWFSIDRFAYHRPALSPPAEGADPYERMQEVAKANGFDSLTQAIAEAVKARDATSTPDPADHIGDATEKVDWERVGPKLVEALAWYGDAGKNALISDAGKRARAALAALSKPNAPGREG